MTYWNWIADIGLSGILDIAFMAVLIYAFLIWFKKTRAASVLTGIVVVAVIYLLVREFNLVMLSSVFERFFAVIFLALIIIFQEELRHIFERIADWSVNRNPIKSRRVEPVLPEVDTLVLTLTDLARDKIGALIVLTGADTLSRHLEGGVALQADLSEPILKSIFDPHSVGHDGAVIVEGNKITEFMAHLPLSKNSKRLGHKGTRHAAALGLSELTDALCLVVSEERGTISLARAGVLEDISESAKLTGAIDQFIRARQPKPNFSPWRDFYKTNLREKLLAMFLSLAAWFVLVQGAEIIYQTVPVEVGRVMMPDPWTVTRIEPEQLDVTFMGPRRAFYFFPANKVTLRLEPAPQPGSQIIDLSPKEFVFPKQFTLEKIEPRTVTLLIENQAPPLPRAPESQAPDSTRK